MDLAVVGTGYVGLASAVCFAELGHTVIGVDIDEEKIAKLQKGIPTIYEPGLEEVLQRNVKNGRLTFTTKLLEALPKTQVLFCAVATPSREDYSADVRTVLHICETVAHNTDHDIVFVNKSTVPVGTGKDCEARAQAILKGRSANIRMAVVSNPEFLRESSAIKDTLHPDRIVVGINGESDWAKQKMEKVYEPIKCPLLFMSRESAEIVKYASNTFLATKISFMNMLSELCEQSGADVRDIAKGMGMDERIGSKFLNAGLGYGGSCFPKDVKAMIALSRHTGVPLPIANAVHDINMRQRARFAKKIINTLPRGSVIAVWGLAFKPGTDDMREAPSTDIVTMLLEAGHKVRVFDPCAMENAKKVLPKEVTFADAQWEALEGADALVILTEWDDFKTTRLKDIKEKMKGSHLFDGRNVFDPGEARVAGFQYHGIGVP